jgi:hypothetical protein
MELPDASIPLDAAPEAPPPPADLAPSEQIEIPNARADSAADPPAMPTRDNAVRPTPPEPSPRSVTRDEAQPFTPFHHRWCHKCTKDFLASPFAAYCRDHPRSSVPSFEEYCQIIKTRFG